MLLNDQIPGLPEWPPIRLNQERHEYVVGGKNLSYARYDMGRKVTIIPVLGGIVLGIILANTVSSALGTVVIFFSFALMLPLLSFSLTKFLCEQIFSSNDQVHFTSDLIVVNGKKYENAPGIPVQFRAQRTALSDKQIQHDQELSQKGKFPKGRLYDYKFRKIEMIYGSRIILITSVADEERADQFAVALQIAHDLAASQPKNPVGRPVTRTPSREDSLPE